MHTPESIASSYGLDLDQARKVLSANPEPRHLTSLRFFVSCFRRAVTRASGPTARFTGFVRRHPFFCSIGLPLAMVIVANPDSIIAVALPMLARVLPHKLISDLGIAAFGVLLATIVVVMAVLGQMRWAAVSTIVSGLAQFGFDKLTVGVPSFAYGEASIQLMIFIGFLCSCSSIGGAIAIERYAAWREIREDRLAHLTRLLELKRKLADHVGAPVTKVTSRLDLLPLCGLGIILGPVLSIVYGLTEAYLPWVDVAMWICFVLGLKAKSPWHAIIASFVAWTIAHSILDNRMLPDCFVPFRLFPYDPVHELVSAFIASLAGVGAARIANLRRFQEALASGERVAVVSEILRLEGLLRVSRQSVCVLVVDASKSAEMKIAQDPLLAEQAFREYQRWIDEHCEPGRGRTVARPGDGAIIAFESSCLALAAAQSMLRDLPNFNRLRNGLSKPFRVRLGLHSGEIMGAIEDVQFTSIIDVAAHAEAVAELNGIAMTKPAMDELAAQPEAKLDGAVDGYPLYKLVLQG